jgi:hypothetical protein
MDEKRGELKDLPNTNKCFNKSPRERPRPRSNSRFWSKVWNQVQVQIDLLMAVDNTVIRLNGLSANLESSDVGLISHCAALGLRSYFIDNLFSGFHFGFSYFLVL